MKRPMRRSVNIHSHWNLIFSDNDDHGGRDDGDRNGRDDRDDHDDHDDGGDDDGSSCGVLGTFLD